MKRFLMLVGVAVVAAAMYVAASPASQKQSSSVSPKQFKALKAEVTRLSAKVTALNKESKAVVGVLAACMQGALPINQFGDNTVAQTEGYNYSQPSGAGNFLTTALDVTASSDTGALWITGSTGNNNCQTVLGGFGFQKAAARAGVQLHHMTLPSTFTAHRHN